MRAVRIGVVGLAVLLAGCAKQPGGAVFCGCVNPPPVPPWMQEDALVAHVGDRVFFSFDKSALDSTARATLDRQGAWLAQDTSLNVLIAGNADERGTETYNLALGERRANVARDYLVAAGVSPARIKTVSYGKDCPMVPGHDEVAHEQNRTSITSVVGYNPQKC